VFFILKESAFLICFSGNPLLFIHDKILFSKIKFFAQMSKLINSKLNEDEKMN